MVWQPVPGWVPGRQVIAYGCGVVSFVSGLGLLWRRTAAAASALAFAYLLLWLVLLRVPAIFIAGGGWVVAETYRDVPWLGSAQLLRTLRPAKAP